MMARLILIVAIFWGDAIDASVSATLYRVSQKKLWIVDYSSPEMIKILSNRGPLSEDSTSGPILFPFVTNCINFVQFPP